MFAQRSDREEGPRPLIFWGPATVGWDGGNFTLEVEHWLHSWPSAWLKRNLGHRLAGLFADATPDVQIEAAEWHNDDDPTTGVKAGGLLRISAPADAWPEPKAFHDAVERGADEAYETARAAWRQAEDFMRGLQVAREES